MTLSLKQPRAVMFDLDGTLVSSSLNFVEICTELGCEPGTDILAFVASLPAAQQRRAHEVIHDYEREDAETAMIIEGVEEVLAVLQGRKINTAIVTRNSHAATMLKLERSNINVEKVVTREMGAPKPAPDTLLNLAKTWGYRSRECCYVGDYVYDLQAANNADMHAVWFANGIQPHPDYSTLADFHFDHYQNFITRLDEYWDSMPS
jgi:HAD superfamily hydrolase (TIGR01509 family)